MPLIRFHRLNSGLADVHNLAYKVAAVHQGWAGPKILDTYEAERRQIALVNAEQSVKNGQKVFSLLRTMGTIDADASKGRENLRQRLADLQARCEVLKGVEEQREHFDNLGLHIGYVYGDKEIPASASLFIPSYRPGARLPHTWISAESKCLDVRRLPPIDSSYVAELSPSEVAAREYSTLDLCSFAAFTLIIATPFRAHWEEQILCLKGKLSKKVAASLKINILALGTDFRLVPGARAREWANGLQLDRGCGVMVRPDQHILEIFSSITSVEEITKTFCTHLDL